ncbi:hypothetical protein FMN63_20840 [Stappia sp. BW2]|uniref:hypothetical protein n=1 Tax=Stappia sp. BW2 TaxID=2592622 RepID=UPI0011DE7642|nr:hypothetical protein [Stappia sp. BW2]TYC64901.1 hypothetical protein FMN63_20840 [Stappia sp. BW2]
MSVGQSCVREPGGGPSAGTGRDICRNLDRSQKLTGKSWGERVGLPRALQGTDRYQSAAGPKSTCD